MFFRKINIQSFHSHVDTTLELERLSFIRGANSSGKSSIEQAIQIVLAGRADATSSDGKGIAEYIRAGAAKASITLAVQQDQSERILKCALNGPSRAVVVTKPGDPQYGGGADFLESLALHKEVLSCLTNNRYFVDRGEDAQKSILAAIILPKTYDWPEWVKPSVHDAGLQVNWSKTPFEVIKQAHDAAYKERTNVNRDIKNFRMPEGDTSEAANLEEYSQLIGTRRQELEAARKRKFEAESESRNGATLLKAAQDRLAGAQGRMAREQQALAGIEGAVLSAAKFKELEKVAKGAAKAEALEKDIARLDAEIGVKKAARTALDSLQEQPTCPTCETAVTPEVVQAILGPLVAAQNKLGDERREAIDARKALGDPAGAKSSLDAHTKAAEDLKKSQARIADEQTVIRDAEAAIEVYSKAGTVDTAAIDAEIADLAGKVEKGNELIAACRAAKDLLGRKEAAEIERTDLTRKQVALEKLVAYFGPDGVKAELLAASIGGFCDSMNDVLVNWGYQCILSIEPYVFAIVYADDAGGSVPIGLKHLSKSQRYRFALAFQVALAIFSGFRFVIVDEADIYDSAGKSGLFAAIDSGELDQAIVMATNEDDDVPDIEGAVFYQLRDVAATGKIPTTQAIRLEPAVEQAA